MSSTAFRVFPLQTMASPRGHTSGLKILRILCKTALCFLNFCSGSPTKFEIKYFVAFVASTGNTSAFLSIESLPPLNFETWRSTWRNSPQLHLTTTANILTLSSWIRRRLSLWALMSWKMVGTVAPLHSAAPLSLNALAESSAEGELLDSDFYFYWKCFGRILPRQA